MGKGENEKKEKRRKEKEKEKEIEKWRKSASHPQAGLGRLVQRNKNVLFDTFSRFIIDV